MDEVKVRELSESIAQIGLVQPLTLSIDSYLLAGRHRFEAVKALGMKKVACHIVPFKHDSPEARLVQIDENLRRRNLSVLEQGELLVLREELLATDGLRAARGGQYENTNARKNEGEESSPSSITTAKLACGIGLSERLAQQRMQIAKALTPRQRRKIRKTPLADQITNLLEIARIRDSAVRSAVIKKMLRKNPPKTVKVAKRECRIEAGEISGDLDIIKPSSWWAFGNPKYLQEDGFRGSIPGEVYANALYYFAPRKGLAADGMAGSGMLKRVYKDRARWQKDSRFDLKILLYDKHPRQPFAAKYGIRRHDMTLPLPKKVDWLFIDPPYFGIASDLYEGKLAKTNDYSKYLAEISKVLQAAYSSLNNGGVLCLLTTEYVDISSATGQTIDVPADIREQALNVGLNVVFRAYVSRGEQQRPWAGQANLKAKRLRRMFSDVCELLVFRRGGK